LALARVLQASAKRLVACWHEKEPSAPRDFPPGAHTSWIVNRRAASLPLVSCLRKSSMADAWIRYVDRSNPNSGILYAQIVVKAHFLCRTGKGWPDGLYRFSDKISENMEEGMESTRNASPVRISP
jgi:hypothetical protein